MDRRNFLTVSLSALTIIGVHRVAQADGPANIPKPVKKKPKVKPSAAEVRAEKARKKRCEENLKKLRNAVSDIKELGRDKIKAAKELRAASKKVKDQEKSITSLEKAHGRSSDKAEKKTLKGQIRKAYSELGRLERSEFNRQADLKEITEWLAEAKQNRKDARINLNADKCKVKR